MTQRVKQCPNSLNLDTVACEKYISRLLHKEKFGIPAIKPITLSSGSHKHKEKVIKHSPANVTTMSQNQLIKVRPHIKQQNLPSPKRYQSPSENFFGYNDEASLIEVSYKANPKQRSKSTVADREPWGQLLKQQKSSEKVSVFSHFDPLRTLHFLAKELQNQLQAILPEDTAIQQMVTDMQYALKRVPPEVASAVHLQQAIDSLPSKKSSKNLDNDPDNEQPEKLKSTTSDKLIQTVPTSQDRETEKLQKVMEESTIKLEASCKQLENLCQELKNEKQFLETQLKLERDRVAFLKKRVEDLELENKEILHPKVNTLEAEKRKLESELNDLAMKLESQTVASATELKTLMSELKVSKTSMEQECSKLKHQLRLSAIEKEKYIAVLAVRNRQISEIRSEMTQLQEVVNEQLMELHNNAFASMPNNATVPGNPALWNLDHNKENIGDVGDGSISTIQSNDDPVHQLLGNKPNSSFKDIPCGDTNILQEVPENYLRRCDGYLTRDHKMQRNRADVERPESQASIRSMFSELKKAAFAITNLPESSSQQSLSNNKQ